MKRLMIACLTLLLVSGCVTHMPYGTQSVLMSDSDQEVMVKDATSQMKTLYPPASTRLNLVHEVKPNDEFGLKLIEGLRLSGYAVALSDTEQEEGEDRNQGLAFSYVLDIPEGTDFYRLSLQVGESGLSRAYERDGMALEPVSPWAHLRSDS